MPGIGIITSERGQVVLRSLTTQRPVDSSEGPFDLTAHDVGTIVKWHTVGQLTVLAAAGSDLAALFDMAGRIGVRTEFPAAVSAEAGRVASRPWEDQSTLEDLTRLPFVTIDEVSSRDLDQALFIRKTETGYEVFYALADASYFAPPGSLLFDEALARGASMYLPAMGFPMLPPVLSEGRVSLNPRVERRAVVFIIGLDDAGERTSVEVKRARVISQAKLSYDEVEAFYGDVFGHPLAREAYAPSLEHLRTVGTLLDVRARERDVVRYDRIELRIDFNDGNLSASRRRRRAVDEYNAQISLLTNSVAAELLAGMTDPGVDGIYKAHPAPPSEELERLQSVISELCELRELPSGWHWDRERASLADYLDALPVDRERVRRALNHQAVRTNVRSTFQPEPGLHYGVGAPQYARVTAPMREVVGIFTHRELLTGLGLGDAPPTDDSGLRARVVEAGNRAKAQQKRLDKAIHGYVLDQLLAEDIQVPLGMRPWRSGTVVGFRSTRLYVLLDHPTMEVKVYLTSGGDRSDAGSGLTTNELGRVCLGDGVRLRVAGREGRRWRFETELELAPRRWGA